MTRQEALKFWEWRYENAKNYYDNHWEADERRSHREYVEALEWAVKALTDHKTEPQTDYKKWDAPPKVVLPTGEITTCVSVLASAFQQITADDFFREPTAEERKAVADYIDSISVPTGVNAFDLMDEPQTERSRR